VSAARCLSVIVRSALRGALQGVLVVLGRRGTIAMVAFALVLIGAATGAARAQEAVEPDSSKSSSSWEPADNVLEVAPVYRPDSSAPSDGCAEDCSGSIGPAAGEAPVAVPGDADNTSNASAGTADTLTAEGASAGDSASDDAAPGDSALDDNGPQQQQAAAGVGQQGTAAPGGSVASAQANDQSRDGAQTEQQAETDRGEYAVEEEAPVIIAAPIGPYAPMPAVAAPLYSGAPIASPAFPSSSWMPRPVPGLPALPRVFPGAPGGFGGGFPRMGGFAVGLGRR